MQLKELYAKALSFEFLSIEEGVFLYHHAPLSELMYLGNELRKIQVPHGKVTWIIDRNMNTTNVCVANCKFCNFYRIPGHPEAYITDIETYKEKIEEILSNTNIFIFDFVDLIYNIGLKNSYNYNLGFLYQMPYTSELLKHFSESLIQFINFYFFI
jgi:hypothetical protein